MDIVKYLAKNLYYVKLLRIYPCIPNFFQDKTNVNIVKPSWMSDDEEHENDVINERTEVHQEDGRNEMVHPDPIKLSNLLSRRKTYGDITQNASERQIKRLLVSLD